MPILAEGVRNQSIVVFELFDFLKSVLNCSDTIREIENAIAISFIKFKQLPELGFPESLFPLVKEVLKKFSII